MIPSFGPSGDLPPGIHWATWSELATRFGWTEHRRRLLAGLRRGLESLYAAGCRTVFVDGSFVTAKDVPNDFDACWDVLGVDPYKLDPVLLTFDQQRAAQKIKFGGEFLTAHTIADQHGTPFVEFFQINKETGRPKGIIAIDFRGFA